MMQTVLKSKINAPNPRYLVPDLSPRDRKALARMRPRAIFVAESPHVSEITPKDLDQRRPLCGVAGRQWWSLLRDILESSPESSVDLDDLIQFCLKHKIVVMNAVQYPLDPKITKEFPGADPIENLGFNKVSGAYSFKKLKNSPEVQAAIQSLRERLVHPLVQDSPIYCLGNDADWFVNQAFSKEEAANRIKGKIPHPSAWWRRGGLYGRIAREKLTHFFAH